jgi:hypothetical protein
MAMNITNLEAQDLCKWRNADEREEPTKSRVIKFRKLLLRTCKSFNESWSYWELRVDINYY